MSFVGVAAAAVPGAEGGGVVGNAVLVVVVLHGGLHRLLRQHRTVDLVGGQAVQRLHHRLVGELQRLGQGLALIISVAMLLVAMADPQPKVMKDTSSMTPSFTLMYIRMMSPHLALPTSPTPLASSMTPTLWGWAKCSMTFSLYSIAIVVTFLSK